ncbi:hypothetical protein ACNQGB_16110 [Flavobacterium sp. XS1P32]|uniref:hypothetical protein n=1 Tax=unclassified Flavobacterium TaxID=196869 RepID=UPI003AAD9CD4
MNDKKNIDRLFQERFKDFESEPSEQVWVNIQLALKEKDKDKKRIPFWIKTSGIAATFLLGVFALYTNTTNDMQKNVVIETKVIKNSFDSKDSATRSTKKERNALEINRIPQVIVNTIKNAKKNEKNNTSPDQFKINSHQEKNQKSVVVYFQKNHSPINQTNSIAGDNNRLQNNQVLENNTQNLPFGKSDAADIPRISIAALDETHQSELSLKTPNELEEILKNKSESEKEIVALNPNKKWHITPNVAAVYLNPNSGGSAIDPQFLENQKTAENSLSFGIGLTYAISKKVALRSGFNRLALGYNTNNVVYTTGLVNNNLSNIRYSSKALIEIKNAASLTSLTPFEKDLQKTNTGAINQKMGYYEIPLEVSYALLDKKFGINLIGGFSTLFLSQNKIALVSSETNVNLGEANNLNPIHFSTNIGLGFRYKILESFQINVEPMLKYQVNTFSNNSGGFTPLFIGLYSGVSYSF